MFKLVAFLFLAAGSNEPISSMTYNQAAFQSADACAAFVESDAGKTAIGALEDMARGRELRVKFACVESKEAKDNII